MSHYNKHRKVISRNNVNQDGGKVKTEAKNLASVVFYIRINHVKDFDLITIIIGVLFALEKTFHCSRSVDCTILLDIYKRSTITIAGVNNIVDQSTTSDLLNSSITANINNTDDYVDTITSRGGGPSPPTSTVGKVLLNTNTKVLNITTASETFNNLRNILKIDSGNGSVSTFESNKNNRGFDSSNYNGGGNKNISDSLLQPGATAEPSDYFFKGYSKNSVKIRQHDSEVSPRPRRSFQSDSSSSRYYNRNSDTLGSIPTGVPPVSSNTNSNNGNNNNLNNQSGRAILGSTDTVRSNARERGSYNYQQLSESNNSNSKRRDYNQHSPRSHTSITDGSNYGRNIHLNSSGNYRQHQASLRYDSDNNSNGNGRQFTPPPNADFNNINHNTYNNHNNTNISSNGSNNSNSKSFGPRSNILDGQISNNNNITSNNINSNSNYNNSNNNYRSLQRGGAAGGGDYYPNNINEYERSSGRYNSNSLERERNLRYSQNSLRQINRNTNNTSNSNNRSYDRERNRESQFENSNNNSRFGPQSQSSGFSSHGLEKSNATISGKSNVGVTPPPPPPSLNSSSSSRGISPNNINNGTIVEVSPIPVTASAVVSPDVTVGSTKVSIQASNQASAESSNQQQYNQRNILASSGAASPPIGNGRWIPPSLRPQHGLTQSEKNDAIFRKVRGILNKLTPEKFKELSDELLKLDLKSTVILKGVILLIFEKALDEPKYSSMYAQLCKRLSEEAPSFEKDPDSVGTFLRLLLNICREKFNTRFKRDTADSDSLFSKFHRPYQASNENDADEDERQYLAKQRMLGNVKFIGELNKLDMLGEKVLHQCIEELLDKKKKRSFPKEDMCEDMECLAQLLKTCGKNLDSEQGKELMNQYFEKLERRSKSTDYPPRIRFMLIDIIELRQNNWVPRKIATIEGPVPIKQIRADDEPLIRTPFSSRSRDVRNNRDDRDTNNWMNPFPFNLNSGGFNEFSQCVSSTGASTITPFYTPPFGNNSNNNRPFGTINTNNARERNNQINNNPNNIINRFKTQGPSISNNTRDDRIQHRDQTNFQYNNNSNNIHMGNHNKEIAPRFKRNLITPHQDAVENLQMRPAANSLLFKVKLNQHQKFPSTLPMSTAPTPNTSVTTAKSTYNNSNNSSSSMNGGNNNANSHNNAHQNSGNNRLMQSPNTHYPLLSSIRLGNTANHKQNDNINDITGGNNYCQSNNNSNSNSNDNNNGNSNSNNNINTHNSNDSSNHMKIDRAAGIKSNTIRSTAQLTSNQEVCCLGQHDTGKKPTENTRSNDECYQSENCLYAGNNNKQSVTKQGCTEKGNTAPNAAINSKQQKKEKALNKEEVLKRVMNYIKEKFYYIIESADTTDNTKEDDIQLHEFVNGFLELKVPDKCLKDACIYMLLDVLEKGDGHYLDRSIAFLQALRKQANIKPNTLCDIFRQVVGKANERETMNPRINSHLASLLCKAVLSENNLLKLNDIASFTDNGQYYPLPLLVLQQLHKAIGKSELQKRFFDSKINLMNCLPEVDRNKTRLSEILDDRSLTFLYPLLKIEAEMMRQLTEDPSPAAFLKWIKTNIESKHYNEENFINALITVIIKYVTSLTTLAEGVDVKINPEKIIRDEEERLTCKYCRVLKTFLDHKSELQLIAIYTLQVFCFNVNFPKGLICRWFQYLYEFEVIDEENYMLWKEDIPDRYPGKCTALCQVNNFLIWLQEAESEDD